MTPELSPLAAELRLHARDRFLLSLFVPPGAREALVTLYALEMELAHVHRAVREEMIGHIRYAWWQEAVEGLYEGKPARGHPVLEALRPLIVAGQLPKKEVTAIIESYREYFPEMPPEGKNLTDIAAASLMDALAPEAKKRWQRAGRVIDRHRARYRKGREFRLVLKLLMLT